MNPPTNNWR